MPSYLAHYVSPAGEHPTRGIIEFESNHRASSKENMHDARMEILRINGNKALSWTIDSIEIKRADDERCGNQMEFDFRAPRKPKRYRQ